MGLKCVGFGGVVCYAHGGLGYCGGVHSLYFTLLFIVWLVIRGHDLRNLKTSISASFFEPCIIYLLVVSSYQHIVVKILEYDAFFSFPLANLDFATK